MNIYKNHPSICNAIILFGVFATSFAFVFIMMDCTINIYDEGIVLTGAMRVAAGDVIHRDFYANYGPAEFYLLSWLFTLFGQHVAIERVFDLFVRSGILTLVYSSVTSYSNRWIAALSTITCALWLSTVGNYGYPLYPTLLLTLGSTWLMSTTLSRNVSIWYPFAAGILTGLSALFRYDIGFFAFLAHIISAIFLFFFTRNSFRTSREKIMRKLIPYVFGAGLPVAIIIFSYSTNGAMASFIHDVILFPSKYYVATRSLPFPNLQIVFSKFGVIHGLSYLAIYIPIAAFIFAFIVYAAKRRFLLKNCIKNSNFDFKIDARGVFVISLAILTMFFYLKGVVRVSIEHMQLSLIPSVIFLSILIVIVKNDKLFRQTAAILAILTVASASATGFERNNNRVFNNISEIIKFISNIKTLHTESETGPISTSQKYKSMFYVDGNRNAAIQYIQLNTSPDQRIFVGLTRHDKIFVNDVSAYFLTKRLPATKWHHFDPGLQTNEMIQLQIIGDIQKNMPPYVWLESTWNDVNENNDSSLSSGVKILDEYIADHYQIEQNFGQISILRHKN